MRLVRPQELCARLNLAPQVLNALIESGQVVVQVEQGQARIDIIQLVRFFQEGLLASYRVKDAPEIPETRPPAAVTAPDVRPRTSEIVRAEEPELRLTARYVPRRHITGTFGQTKFLVLQISHSGLRIRHTEPLEPGAEERLSFAILNPARSFIMRGRVAWTSVATTGAKANDTFHVSGIHLTEHPERIISAIELLERARELQPAMRRTSSKKGPRPPLDGISDEEIATVIEALHHFHDDPLEAGRWYSRGRFAVSDPSVRRDAPNKGPARDEVLAIWEYLQRRIEVAKIADIVSCVQRKPMTAPPAGASQLIT